MWNNEISNQCKREKPPMNPSAPPLKDEKFDSLKRSYASMKDAYNSLLEKNKKISNDLRVVESKLCSSLVRNLNLELKRKNQGMVFLFD